MSVLAFIQNLWPEASVRADINTHISIAEAVIGDCFGTDMIGTLGTKTEYARALRAMHSVALITNATGKNYSGGVVKSEKTGELSIDYQIDSEAASQFPDLAQTVWGVMLIAFLKSQVFKPIIVSPCLE